MSYTPKCAWFSSVKLIQPGFKTWSYWELTKFSSLNKGWKEARKYIICYTAFDLVGSSDKIPVVGIFCNVSKHNTTSSLCPCQQIHLLINLGWVQVTHPNLLWGVSYWYIHRFLEAPQEWPSQRLLKKNHPHSHLFKHNLIHAPMQYSTVYRSCRICLLAKEQALFWKTKTNKWWKRPSDPKYIHLSLSS